MGTWVVRACACACFFLCVHIYRCACMCVVVHNGIIESGAQDWHNTQKRRRIALHNVRAGTFNLRATWNGRYSHLLYEYVNIYACMSVTIYVYTYMYIHKFIYICTYIHIYIHMYEYIYIYMYVYIYIYV